MANAMMIVCGHPLPIIGDGAKLALLSQRDWNFEMRELARA